MEERTGKERNREEDSERTGTEAEPSNSRQGGQQLMWRYMVKEKKMEKMKDEPDTKNLITYVDKCVKKTI